MKHLLLKHSRKISGHQLASSSRYKRLTSETLSTAVQTYLQKYLLSAETALPPQITFIFGHTHQPENMILSLQQGQTQCHVYNTGGWVADRLDAEGEFILPQAVPLYLSPEGVMTPINVTKNHEDFLRHQLQTDPTFVSIRQTQRRQSTNPGNPQFDRKL